MSTTFEPGARPTEGSIPLSVPEIRGNEWKYVKECLDTGWVSSGGSFVDRFEREVAQHVGARHAVATVNGSAALHISLLIAGVEPYD
jgi:perosamine synthetase